MNESFDAWAPGQAAQAWRAFGGQWGGTLNTTNPSHPKVAFGEGSDALNSLVSIEAGSFANFELNVSFNMIAGDHPQGAGLAFHFRDADNYQIIRYSISEQGWHIFTVREGNRDKQSDGTVQGNTTSPQFHEWVRLRVLSQDGHVVAYDGTTRVIDYVLPTEQSAEGGVALFVRGNTVAQFDDFSVRPG